MQEPNPFSPAETLEIVETRPARPVETSRVKAIRILPDPRDPRGRPRAADIDAMLASLLAPQEVKLLDIAYESRLTRLPALDRLANLAYAHIGGKNLRSHAPLHQLRRVRSLSLVSYGAPTMAGFQHLELDACRLVRGRVERFDLPAARVALHGCTRLVEVGEVRARQLEIDGCERLELASLARVHGMSSLSLRGRKDVPSLAFVGACAHLEHLLISGNSLRRCDLSPIWEHPRLERVFLGNVGAARLAEIARRGRHLVVTNGDACFRDGQRAPDCDAYYEPDARRRPRLVPSS